MPRCAPIVGHFWMPIDSFKTTLLCGGSFARFGKFSSATQTIDPGNFEFFVNLPELSIEGSIKYALYSQILKHRFDNLHARNRPQ